MKKKFDLALQATYDMNRDRVVLVADKKAHPALSDAGFHVALKAGTDSDAALREQLLAAGVIEPPAEVKSAPSIRDLYDPVNAAFLELLVDSGRSIAVVGAAGSGKSTLLDAMAQRVLNTKPVGRTVLMHEEHAFEAIGGPRVRVVETPRGVGFYNVGYSVVVKDALDSRWVQADASLVADIVKSFAEAASAKQVVDDGAVLYVAVEAFDARRAMPALSAVGIDTVILLERDANADAFSYPNVSMGFYLEGRQVLQ